MKLIKKKKPSRSNSVEYRKSCVGEKKDVQLLETCARLWDNLREVRERRARAMRFVYGDHWDDLITIKGKTMTQREYITSVGNVALQTNQIKKIVETIAGVYVRENNEPTCKARDRKEQIYGELMSITVQTNWQINDMPLLSDTALKEAIIGGIAGMRETYEYRQGRLDSWTDIIHPNYIIFDSRMIDPRHYDMEIIGEIHDISFTRFCEKFAKSREDVEKFTEWYANESSPIRAVTYEDINDKHDERELTFYTPKDKSLCRVYEVWRKESRDRYRCHDEQVGQLYHIDADDYESLNAIKEENRIRRELAKEQGLTEDEIPLIRTYFYVDTFWYGRFLTPQGYILWEGESPYDDRKCPYNLMVLPMIDGKIVPYIWDAIDQNIAINRILTLYDWMVRAGLKGVTYVPKDAIPDDMDEAEFAEQMTTIDGVVFYEPSKSGNKPETLYGHTNTINLSEIVRMMSDLMESSVSVTGAIRGEAAHSGTAAALYAQQTQNSATPLASLMMRFSIFMKRVAALKLSNINKFYTPERFEEIAGAELTKAVGENQVDFSRASSIEYDLSIAQSTTTPIYRAIKTQILMDFVAKGMLPPRFLFEFGDIPGADEIIQRLDAMQQNAQENPQQIAPDYDQKKEMFQSLADNGEMEAVKAVKGARIPPKLDLIKE